MSFKISALLLLCFFGSCWSYIQKETRNDFSRLNFIGIRDVHGKHELRVARHGILALEVTIPGRGESDLFIRLVSDGQNVVKLFYTNSNNIELCEVEENDREELFLFMAKFFDMKRSAYDEIGQEQLLQHLSTSGNFTVNQVDRDGENTYSHLLDIHRLIKECRKSHKSKKAALKAYHKQTEQKRHKRQVIYPGTKWCGTGSTSLNYDDLGEAREEDKCCRTHDFCEFMIEGMTTRWDYFNPRVTTISHCDCDDKFLTCLHNLNTQVADMIGEIFFNIVKTECFIFKRVRKCTKKKWWGSCAKYEMGVEVEVKEPFAYYPNTY